MEGGVRSIDDIHRLLDAGANKISICTAAIHNPELIREVAEKFGAQCIVVSIDAKKMNGFWHAFTRGGRNDSGLDVIEWSKKIEELGAGEILLNSIDADGTRKGYDLELTKTVAEKVNIPIIASGGAGNLQQILDAIVLGKAEAVQLRQGREKLLEVEKPVNLAKGFDEYGEIAVIDLDRATGKGNNLEIIKKICKIAECRVGGGIRSIEEAKELLSYGAKKVIIGTKAFENDTINHKFLKSLRDEVGVQRIIIAIDSINQKVMSLGWSHGTGLNVFDALKETEEYCSEFLYTCIEKEGGIEGTDIETLEKLRRVTKNRITAAGGISSIEEIKKLSMIGIDAQLGMALYTGKIKLQETFIACLNWENGLIPTIVKNTDEQVLMLAYSSKESLKETFLTGKMYYFSRTRNKLWRKGETSGNTQEFLRVRADCDRDAILFTVKQKGVACHTGSYSCFGDKKFSLESLYEVVKDRIEHPKRSSYTSKLTLDTLKEKILEESKEIIEAKEKEDIIWETADILYFLTVLLAKNGIRFDDVIQELRRRRRWK